MYTDLFTPESLAELKTAFVTQFPMALWETFYVTVLSTALAVLFSRHQQHAQRQAQHHGQGGGQDD